MQNGVAPNSPGEDLLTIREAAALLNVSAVSLRRWTDAGKLACLRVGGRRERRFRRQDLLSFGEKNDAAAPRQNGVVLEGMPIDYGSHLCSIYETNLGRVKLSVPFLVEGLGHGDICFLIAGPEARAHILKTLGDTAVDVERACTRGQLSVSEGASTGEEMYDTLEAAFVAAIRDGNRGLRVVGDMGWFLDKGMDVDDLRRFEMRFDQYLAHAYPVVSLCQYDARRFSGVGLLTALKTHQDTFELPLSRFLAS